MQTDETTLKIRWSRAQRFQLSGQGQDAHTAYCEMIAVARSATGRQALEEGRDAWAKQHALESTDGLYLSELHEAPRTIAELAVALDGCGPTRDQVPTAVQRLVQQRMVVLVTPPAPPSPPPYRW